MNAAPVEVNICPCQTVQLTHTQAGSQQDHNVIIVVPTAVLHELKILLLLLLGQRIAYIGVFWHHVRQLELERVLADDVIIHRHFKCRSDNALQDADGVLLDAAVVQEHKPAFCVGQLYGFDRLLPERVGMNPLDRRTIRPQGVLLQTPFQIHIAVNQLCHGHFTRCIVDAVRHVAPQLVLFLPQLCQGFGVNTTPFLVYIGITIVIGAVCSLALAILQNTTFAIFALFRQFRNSFP